LTLVAAFAGWNDAGQAATAAVRFLIDAFEAEEIASIDPEEFYDFTASRPVVRIGPGEQRALEWPANRFFLAARPERGIALLLGEEPHLKWRAFTSAVLDVAGRLNCRTVFTLGGLVGDAVHTRPVPLAGYSLHPALRPRFDAIGITGSRYEGPTGIVGALHDRCRQEMIPSASLWAAVPQYLGTTPNPKAALALLEALDRILEIGLDLRELRAVAEEFEASVTKAVSQNRDVLEIVRFLERQHDTGATREESDLPPPAAIIEDLEEFLRKQRERGEQA
jgi:predicted ATP-grasp superfamily ATP-dependent carboligase